MYEVHIPFKRCLADSADLGLGGVILPTSALNVLSSAWVPNCSAVAFKTRRFDDLPAATWPHNLAAWTKTLRALVGRMTRPRPTSAVSAKYLLKGMYFIHCVADLGAASAHASGSTTRPFCAWAEGEDV